MRLSCPVVLVAGLILSAPAVERLSAQSAEGGAVFTRSCASCHDGAETSRAPAPEQLRTRSPESIVDALTGGAMRYQGLTLTGAERRAVAEFLAGRSLGSGRAVDPDAGRCASPAPLGDLASHPLWNGWGPTLANTHFQSAGDAGLTAAQLPKLTLAWAFGFPEATSAWAQPTIAGGRLFVGSQNGTVYALDAKAGCVIWHYEAQGGVRGAVSIGRRTTGAEGRYGAYFSDQRGYAYAVDADTGKQLWRVLVDEHPLVRLTGSPVLHQGRLYVPTSSYEEAGKAPDYACCTFRGSIVALDAMTGREIWRTYMVAEEPKVMGRRADGGESWGPSGGAVWSAPTIDEKRGVMYVGVGNTYSGTTQPMTDAIVALALDGGAVQWVQQVTPVDVFGCRTDEPNCSGDRGPDFDFGASPVLTTRSDGRDIVVVGQKSGVGYALDPDDHGRILWQYRAGRGGALGGIEWGIAADGVNAYFPVADNGAPQPGGLHAVNLMTGERAWFAAPTADLKCERSRRCSAAQSAAITVIPGVVFSGAFDGGIRAYSTSDGRMLWDFDTNKEFLTINGIRAHGASINGPAPVVIDGMLYVSSGDYRARPGNVLLAFSVNP
jgi:polyvinyl alcohol dehydrogenase (cytochrome)